MLLNTIARRCECLRLVVTKEELLACLPPAAAGSVAFVGLGCTRLAGQCRAHWAFVAWAVALQPVAVDAVVVAAIAVVAVVVVGAVVRTEPAVPPQLQTQDLMYSDMLR